MQKLKIKSKYNFVLERIDLVSICMILFLIGFYCGAILSFSLILLAIIFLNIIALISFRNKIFLLITAIFIGIILSSLYFNLHTNLSAITNSKLNFISSYKIVVQNKALWLEEKYLINESDKVPFGAKNVFCDETKLVGDVQEKDLLNQGINREITCATEWRYYENKNFFTNLNSDFAAKLDSFSRDQADLLKGITLGISPSRELSNEFQRVGLTHILVISGFNITLILTIVLGLLSKFKNIIKIIFALIFIMFFVMIVGPTPPVVRAAIMGIIGYLTLLNFKNISILRVLLFSGLVMIIWDPYTIFSLSFLLSFLATLGLILFSNDINKYFYLLPKIIRESFVQTIAATILTLPLTINTFSTFSPVFIIANILVLPFLSILSILAYVYILTSFVVYIDTFKNILAFLSDIILQISFYLASFKNSLIILNLEAKSYFNIFILTMLIIFTVIYIKDKLKIYNRIDFKKESKKLAK